MAPSTEIPSFGLIGENVLMKDLRQLVQKIAPHNATVLIEGESGTGKELVAKAIHFNSPRKDKEFVIVNCAALPDQLLESELFGHMRGSFTGAIAEKKGLFQVADKGTFFLDEVGDMSLASQVKLLRVLQEGVFFKIGGTSTVKVDVRVIAATNQNLKQAVKNRKFREDLFFRLNVMHLVLPPLRERKSDIPLLVSHISKRIAEKNGQKVKEIAAEVLAAMKAYHWPGNVRELENELERAYVLAAGDLIDLNCLSLRSRDSATNDGESHAPKAGNSLKDRKRQLVAELEKEMIREALDGLGGNQTRAAKKLGISRQELIRKIKLHKIPSS